MAKTSTRMEYIMSLNAREWNTVQADMVKRAQETADTYNQMKQRISEIKEALKTATDPSTITSLHTELGKLTTDIGKAKTEMETWKHAVDDLPKGVDKVTAAMNRMASGGSLSAKQLQEAIKAAEKQLQNFGNSRNAGKDGYGQADMQRLRGFINQAKEAMAALNADFLKADELIRKAGATSVEQGQRLLSSLAQIRSVTKNTDTMIDAKGNTVNKLEAIDAAINRVNADMERLKVNSSDVSAALAIGKQSLKSGGLGLTDIKGSINDLERMRAAIIAAQKATDQTTTEGKQRWKELNAALNEVTVAINRGEMGMERYKAILDSLGKGKPIASIFELKQVVSTLEKEMEKLNANTEQFNKTALKLQQAKAQLKALTDQTKVQVSTLENAISRLKTYVMVYMGFQQAITWTRQIIGSNLQLSDSLSDIQKRTRLTDEAIKEISNTLDGFDTRNTQLQLANLAATAGLLGLKSKEDIIGFTRAADEMSVALVELGSDGAAQLMKIATLTGDVAKYGTEQALIKTGSAINELTASSAASAGPITDFISRMGAVGSQAKLTMGDIAGIGATLDALGQPVELSATSMNRFIMALQGNKLGLMAALGMTDEEMTKFEQLPTTMAQMEAVLRKMQENGGGVSALSMVFDEMGSEGVRLKQTISSLIGNVDLLHQQVEISNKAFEEGVSVTNEYNMKNNNAAAIMQRTGNMIQEYFSNSDMVDVWKGVAQSLYNITKGILSLGGLIKWITALWIGWKVQIIASNIQFKEWWTMNVMSKWKSFGNWVSTIGSMFRQMGAEVKAARMGMQTFGQAASQCGTILKGMGSLNPFGAIMGAVSTLAVIFLPDLLTWLGKTERKLEDVRDAADTFAEGQLNYVKAIGEVQATKLPAVDEEFEQLQNLTKGTDEYNAAREKLAATYKNELSIAADHIRNLDNIKEYEGEITALVEDQNEKAQVHELAENLADAQRAAEDAQEQVLAAAKDTDEYKDAQQRLSAATAAVTKARNEALPYMQVYADKLATEVTSCNNAVVAHDAVTKSIMNEAKARAANAAAQAEEEQMQKVLTNAKTELEAYGKKHNMSADEIAKLYTDAVTYLTGGKLSQELKNVMDSADKALQTRMSYGNMGVPIWQSGDGKGLTSDLTTAITGGKKSLDEHGKALKVFQKWATDAAKDAEKQIGSAIDDATSGVGDAMNSARMRTGWDKVSMQNESQPDLNKRSTTLHTMWTSVKPTDQNSLNVFSAQVGQKFKSYDEALKWVQGVVKSMKEVSKDRSVTLEGGWQTQPKGRTGGSKKDTTEQEMEDARKHLKEYYDARATMATEALNEGRTNETAYAQFIAENNRLLAQDQQNLERKFMDTNRKFTTAEVDAWMKSIEGVDGKRIDINYAKIEKYLSDKGKNLVGKIRENAANYGKQVQDLIKQNNAEIEKIVGESNPFYTLINSMRDEMGKMGALLNINELLNLEDAAPKIEQRVKFLVEWMQNAYTKDAAQFIADVKANPDLSVWGAMLEQKPELAQAIVIQLQSFYDKIQDAVKKQSQSIKRGAEYMWNLSSGDGTSMKQQYEEATAQIERMQSAITNYNSAVESGYFAENAADKLGIAALQSKLKMQRAYLELIKEEAKRKLATAQANERNLRAQATQLAEQGQTQAAAEKIKQADAQLLQIDNLRKAAGYAIKDQNAEILETTNSIDDKQNEMQKKLITYIRSWNDWFQSSVSTLINGYGTQNNEKYTTLAANRAAGVGDDDAQDVYIVENAGTKNATASVKSMTTNERLEWEIENEQRQAQQEAWKEVMQSFSEKMNDTINDMIARMTDNQIQAQQTDATIANTQAIQQNTEALLGGSNDPNVNDAVDSSLDVSTSNVKPDSSGAGGTTVGSNAEAWANTPDYMRQAEQMQDYAETVTKANKSITTSTTQTNDTITSSTQQAYSSMMQAANLYGITYNAIMNDNLSTTQKVEMIMIQTIGQTLMSILQAALQQMIAGNATNLAEATGKVFAQSGWGGFAGVAAITAAIGAATALATSAVTKAKTEISSVTSSSSSAGRMATGMLTYAEGRYPVLGNDGQVYDAQYEGSKMKTGVYRGGAHFGIFSEKEPEMVLSGSTTRAVLNTPLLASAIDILDRYGRLPRDYFTRRTMRTHAEGTVSEFSIPAVAESAAPVPSASPEGLYSQLNDTMAALTDQLSRGISATINMYGDGGLDDSIAKRDRYNARNKRR